MMWDENNGDRKAILALAQPELKKKAATTNKPAEPIAITKQLVDHLTSMGINAHNREEMIQYLNEHGYNSIQEAIMGIDDYYLNSEYLDIIPELQEIVKANKYNKAGTDAVILNSDKQTIYLIDHSNQEEFEVHKNEGRHGVGIRNVYKLKELTKDGIREIIQNISPSYGYSAKRIGHALQAVGLTKEYLIGISLDDELERIITSYNEAYGKDRTTWPTGGYGSRRYNYNDSKRSRRDEGSLGQEEQQVDGVGSGVTNITAQQWNDDFQKSLQSFITPQGEIYGFVAPNGDIYLDETVISPEHPIHEYTHLWDRYVFELNPKLWQTGIDIFKKTSLWNEILNNENYGKKWQAMQGMTPDMLDTLIASEIHARLTGERGREILDQIAKDKGSKDIIGKLKQWLLDFWKTIKSAFSPWTDEQLQRLNSLAEKDIDKALKYLSDMALKDFAEGVNPINSGGNIQPIERRRLLTKSGNNLQDNTFVDIDKAIMSGKWSDKALDELENLNTDSYDKILKRFSQEELRGSNENLIQAEAIIQRGERGADRKNTQDYGERAKQQEQQIESWALME